MKYLQIDVHYKIDLLSRIKVGSVDSREINRIITTNRDARDYFYYKIQSNWVDWLFNNGFFSCLSKRRDPESQLTIPELSYLDRAAKDKPDSVVKVILATMINKASFNPDVVSRFVRIMSSLPAKQIVRLIPKLTRENWVKLLNRYNHWGFEYEEMFKTLTQAKEYQAIINLANVVLSIKEVAHLRGGKAIYVPEDDTFYFDNLGETYVFSALHALPIEYHESALKCVSATLSSVVELWASQSEKIDKPDNPFDKNDHFMLASYIPSDIKPREQEDKHRDDNLYDLTASLLYLFDSLAAQNPKASNIKRLYQNYFATLPNSQAMWRLKLYIIKQRYPKVFKTEYSQAKESGYTKIESTLSEPLIGPIISGEVVHRSPITQDEFNKLSLESIVGNLQSIWAPSALAEQSRGSDFLNPLAPDAIGDLIRDDLPNRAQEYLNHANSFFNLGSIHLHYTHRYLSALQEYIKANRAQSSKLNWDQPIQLLTEILNSTRTEPRKERGSWLANWDWLYSTTCELLTELLTVEGDISPINFAHYRKQLLSFIGILFQYPDPTPADENIKTATSITSNYGDKTKEITDPYAMAINSVRGKAHRSLLSFVYRNGKALNKDVKNFYEEIIKKENTRAIYFLFGHQLPPFYYRDTIWTKKMFKIMFHNSQDDLLSLAAWEGYLSNNLYHEIFSEKIMQGLYSESIGKTRQYPNQKYFLDPQKGLAGHLALAFMYYDELNYDHPLFKKFWKSGTQTQQSEFINTIGHNLTSTQDKRYITHLGQDPKEIEKLQKLWTILLESKLHPEVLEAFGYWIGPNNEVFDPSWIAKQIEATMTLTKGRLSWDYGLTQSIVPLAKVAPKEVVQITKLFFNNLISDDSRHPTERYVEKEWKDALKIAYDAGEHELVKSLINQLIAVGGQSFWTLKDILSTK